MRRIFRPELTFAIVLLVPMSVFATAQTPDEIRIGESVYPLCVRPILASYFAKHPDHDIAKGIGGKFEPCNPDPDYDGLYEWSTSLFREYVARFAFVDGRLVVEEIWTTSFGGGDEWTPIIECAMPDSDSRNLDWYSGPIYYLRIDQVENTEDEQEEYSLFQVDVENGRLVSSKKIKSEIHGHSSGISCSAGWGAESEGWYGQPVEEPIISRWCIADSSSSGSCFDEENE